MSPVTWAVVFHPEFEPEFDALDRAVQDDLLAHVRALAARGPVMGRSYVDTLKGSVFPNMKELRFGAENGIWRLAFVFDPERRAVLLVAGDKKGANQRRFYAGLIRIADRRCASHLEGLAKRPGSGKDRMGRKRRP
ncbi:MAG: addiction module toxin RelE [Alphaproteobacteria bacterium]|nr:addiction module toxin RelE [Alphaproteobacteria bacterium]